jgi:hypothetical protein
LQEGQKARRALIVLIPADILSFLLPAVSFLPTEIRGGCKAQWHAYFSPMPIDGLRQTFQLQR